MTKPRPRRRGQVPTLFEEGYYAERDGKPRKPPEHYNMQSRREWDKGWCYGANITSVAKLLLPAEQAYDKFATDYRKAQGY